MEALVEGVEPPARWSVAEQLSGGYVAIVLWPFLLFATCTIIMKRAGKYHKGRRLPPGPPFWPIIGNLLQLGALPHRNVMNLQRRYGPILYLRLGSIGTVCTDDPKIIREILKTKDNIYASRPTTIASEHLAYDGMDVAMAPYGDHWKHSRKICVTELLTPKRLEGFQRERTEEARFMVHSVWTDCTLGKASDLKDALGTLSMNVMTRMLLGKRYFGTGDAGHTEAQDFKQTIHDVFWLLGVHPVGDYLPFLRWLDIGGYEKKMIEVEKNMDAFHKSIVKEHRRKALDPNAPADFVDVLLSLPGEKGEQQLSDQTVKALVQDMIAAATDTSSVLNEWAMAELIRHPHMLRKAQEEVDRVVGCDRMVLETDLQHLKYLRCVIKETFRLHPPGNFLIPHLAMADDELGGYMVPKGTRILINTWGFGRNPSLWQNPEVFDPERWQEGLVEINDAQMRILPFGIGRRSCPGSNLGSTMLLWALSSLVHGFDWRPAPAADGTTDIDMQEKEGLTSPKLKPLLAYAHPRLPPHLYQI